MPSIVINEKDETLAGLAASSTDVAFVPGFAATNTNYLIFDISGVEADRFTPGFPTKSKVENPDPQKSDDWVDANIENISFPLNDPLISGTGDKPQFACNVIDKKTWKCVSNENDVADEGRYVWVEQDNYIQPCPENVPTLCTTLAEFETYFGKTPYQFGENAQSEEKNSVYDLFEAGVIPRGNRYMYRSGDFEKSYTYAKELIRYGLPVVYENICERGTEKFDYGDSETATKGSVTYNRSELSATAKDAKFTEMGIYSFEFMGDGKWCMSLNCAEGHIIKNIEDYLTITGGAHIGDIIIIKVTKDASITVEVERGDFEGYISVNETVLKSYMVEKGAPVCNASVRCKEVNGKLCWVAPDSEGEERVIDIEDMGLIVREKKNVAVGDYFTFYCKFTRDYQKEEPSVKYLYNHLSDCYTNPDKLLDKGEYTIKYITSGAYPVYELKENVGEVATAMIQCAYNRGDAVALIDHANNPERPLKGTDGSGSVYSHVKNKVENRLPKSDELNTFGAMFTPWATYSCTTAPANHQVITLPASFGYLTALGVSIVTNPNWIATAGVNRGLPPTIGSLDTIERLTNTIADSYQPRDNVAINAITFIKPYGLTIWGNRTLVSNADGNLKATSFLNIRNAVSDIKKLAYTSAKSLMFEQNSDLLWNKFKTKMTPLLDKMISGYGLSSYKLIRGTTKYNGDPLAKGEVAAIIKIVPLYAVEDFEITVVMSDENVDVQ